MEERPAVPDFGLMLCEDGDFSNTSTDVEESVRNLRAMMRTIENSGIKTFMHGIGPTSDMLFYESEHGSVFGWREVPGLSEYQQRRLPAEIAVREAGVDPLMIVAEETAAMGMHFFPTYRMNDAHYGIGDPLTNWFTGEFWMENQDKTIGQSPIPDVETYTPLLDYSYREVYEYRQAIVFEAMERYAGVMEGFELDFGRTPFLFAPGTQQENKTIMTDFVREAREKLDVLGEENDRYYWLVARVSATMENCHWAGLEVDEWIADRLIDVVIPSQIMTASYDMPIDDFLEPASQSGVSVYLGVMQRTNWIWPFARIPEGNRVSADTSRALSLPLMAGISNYYRSIGVDGFQLYNFNLMVPPVPGYAELYAELADPDPYQTRAYGVTPSFFRDDLDTYEYRKQIPATLANDTPVEFTFPVGENFEGNKALSYLALRIGLGGATVRPGTLVRMSLNGHSVHEEADPATFMEVPAEHRGRSGIHGFIQVEVDPSIVMKGDNALTLTYLKGEDDGEAVVVQDLILGAEFEEAEAARLSSTGSGGQ